MAAMAATMAWRHRLEVGDGMRAGFNKTAQMENGRWKMKSDTWNEILNSKRNDAISRFLFGFFTPSNLRIVVNRRCYR